MCDIYYHQSSNVSLITSYTLLFSHSIVYTLLHISVNQYKEQTGLSLVSHITSKATNQNPLLSLHKREIFLLCQNFFNNHKKKSDIEKISQCSDSHTTLTFTKIYWKKHFYFWKNMEETQIPNVASPTVEESLCFQIEITYF